MKLKPIQGSLGSTLRINDCPDDLRESLQRALTFRNPLFDQVRKYSPWENTRVPEHVCMMGDYVEYTEIPRGFSPAALPTSLLPVWESVKWQDCRTVFNVKFPSPRLAPNDEQREVLTSFREAEKQKLRPTGTYMFVVPTSGGKTIAQALLASEVGQRTLVLCKTNLIKKAWQENLYSLFGMNEEDLGDIQQKSFRLGKHVTLASIATLSRRKHLWHELFSQIGCLIIDECHLIGASTIREITVNCPARYIFGMTATDTRRDGMTFTVNACLGNPLLRIENKQTETQSSLPLKDAKLVRTSFAYVDSHGKPIVGDMMDYQDLVNRMITDDVRNAQIVEEVYADWKAGHSVVVVTPRISHVFHLTKLLQDRGIRDANHLTGVTNQNKFYTDKLLEALFKRKCRCLVASQNAIKLGANINPLDRMHIAVPPSNKEDLEQLVGRIRRKYAGKKDAVLTYYQDVRVPYWMFCFRRAFMPAMHKLCVKRFENVFIA